MQKKHTIKLIILLTICSVISGCAFGRTDDDVEGLIVNNKQTSYLNLAVESIDTMNPLFTNSESVRDCLSLIYVPLYTFDASLNPIGVLAESITTSDYYNYTVKIKNGVLWHNSDTLDSYDVLHSINLIRYNQSPYSDFVECIGAANAPDSNIVTLTLTRPIPNIEALLSFPIVPDGVTPTILPNFIPVGTGPYKYDAKISSDKIRLIKNENWHQGLASINEVHLNILKDKESVINAFDASEIDAVTSTLIDLKTNTPRGNIYTNDYTSNNMTFLGINNSSSVLSGSNTRKAISYLIDKNDIVKTEIFQRGQVASVPVNPSAWYATKISDTTYDETYISEMLALDGWVKNESGLFIRNKLQTTDTTNSTTPAGEQLKLSITVNENNEERLRIATKIADKLNSYGIETTVTILTFEDYIKRIDEKNYSLFIGEMTTTANSDPYSMLCKQDNYFAYSSARMNDAVYRLGLVKTSQEVISCYAEFASIFQEEMPFIPLFFRTESVIFEKSVSGTSMPNIFISYPDVANWYFSSAKPTGTNSSQNFTQEN